MPESLGGPGYSCISCIGMLAAKAVTVFLEVHAVLFGILPLLPVLESDFEDLVWALKNIFIQCSKLLKSSGMCENTIDNMKDMIIEIFRDVYQLKDGNMAVIGNMLSKGQQVIAGVEDIASNCF